MSDAQEWQVIVFIIIIWALGVILQGGYATRARLIYIIKLILLWLLQPFTLVVTIWSAVDNGNNKTGAVFIISIIFAVLTFLSWLRYWYDSIRLVIKTHSAWSFSPESRLLAGINDPMGNWRCIPIDHMAPILAPVVKHGKLKLHGQELASGVTVSSVPKSMIVVSPSDTFHYTLKKTIDTDERDFAVLIYQGDRVSNAGLHSITTSDSGNARLYKYL
ncbi:membrane protein [Thrush coronavirus HKU12-600]|uniref:Membrane protein n=1 Tax=Thrush coronavirus HKU12 (isolate Grey-backed thrush/Hong Kong/HKU12-600/2007) TaxID=572290 RepID=B6VDY0_THCOV|nr:membrane protein [Thrush coronavirus HKU12-600]ACJ12055.1 membrane protein [Thrush coronavirus HKU12-600]QLI47728.1 MAG: M protein [Deltacoronavirus sp.]QLI47743.1 MAG: M protein [Deltacoronavirus sp.]